MRWIFLVVLLLPGAAAQGIFITDNNTAAGTTGDTTYTMTTDAPTAETSFKNYIATGFGVLTYTTAYEWTVSETFTTTGPSTWTAYVSCDEPTVFRPGNENGQNDVGTYRVHLFNAGTEVAVHPRYDARTCDGPNDIWEAVFTLDATGTTFNAGTTLRVENIIWVPNGAPGTGLENVYMLGGSLAHPSGLTGPGIDFGAADEGPVVIEANITDQFRHTFEKPHNNTYVFHFNGTDGMVGVIDVNGTQGNATIKAAGPLGEALNDTFSGVQQSRFSLSNGTWTIRVAYDAFVGVVGFSVASPSTEAPPGGGPDDGGDGSDPDEGGPGAPNGTDGSDGPAGNTTGQPGQESPALPVLIPLLLAVLLRRRQS